MKKTLSYIGFDLVASSLEESPGLPPHEDVPEVPSPLPVTIPVHPLAHSTHVPFKKRAFSPSASSPVRGEASKKRRRLDDAVDAAAVASTAETLQVPSDDGDTLMDI